MSSILGEFQSVEALAELAVSEGFGGQRGKDGQFRRAAWLYLLGLPYSVNNPSKPAATSNLNLNLLQQSQNLDSQLDKDGWQLTRDFGLADSWIQTEHNHSQDDEWQTATSKRSKRTKRNTNGSEFGIGNEDQDQDQDQEDEDGRESNTTSSNSQLNSSVHSNSPEIKKSLLTNNRSNLEEIHSTNQDGKSKKSKKKSKKKHKKDNQNSNQIINGDSETRSNRNEVEKGGDGDGEGHHKDERQVELDIMRSFVGFQDGALKDTTLRERRRDQLREIVVGVLRKHPALSYFQGYHDILSIILLTLNPRKPPSIVSERTESPWDSIQDRDLTLKACERISLHFVRDSMTENMDPVMGQLKVVRNILRLVDRDLANQVEQASPLPFFALPWLLTILSHDLPFETTQMIFDFIISHGPSSVLYLCVSIILTKKETLDKEPDLCSDPAFLHQYLSQLPDFQYSSTTSTPSSNPIPISTSSSTKPLSNERDPNSDSTEIPTNDLMTESEHLEKEFNEKAVDDEDEEEEENSWERKREPIKIELSEILKKSKDMMKTYPLELVADPMGRKSVLWTWEEIFTKETQVQVKDSEKDLLGKSSDSKNGAKNGNSKSKGKKISDEKSEDQDGNQVNSSTSNSPPSPISTTRSLIRKPESEDWKLNDSLAEEAITGEISQIVKDPKPSPPNSIAGDESPICEWSKESKELKGDGKGKKKKKRDTNMTLAATAVGVAGVLLAVYSASNSNSNGQLTRSAIGFAGALLGMGGEDW